MSTFVDKNVLVTGGAGHIGRLLALKAGRAGASNVIIWDVNAEQIQDLTHDDAFRDLSIHTNRVDISKPVEIYSAAERIHNQFEGIDILFNNAGVVTGKYFREQSPEEIQRLIEINVLGSMHTARAFLPEMIKIGRGHIVNISSASSLMANPRMSVYAGSKWAITGWSESLRLELEETGKDLYVTTVQPSYVKTKMFEGATAPLLTPILEPEYITDKIIEAVKLNKIWVREPFMVKLIPLLKGIMPTRLFDFIAGELFNTYHSMESFKGKNNP